MKWRKYMAIISLRKKVDAGADGAIQEVGNSMLYLVMLALIMIGIGVGAAKFLSVANVTDPSKLPIVGGVFSGITQGISMGSVAIVVAFIAIIIGVLAVVWQEFKGGSVFS